MAESSFSFGNVENKGAMVIGKGNATNTNVNQADITDATQKLIDLIRKNTDMPDDLKQEVEETINAVADQAKSDKPNKTILSALLGSTEKVFGLIQKTPELIATYESWRNFIAPLIGG